MEFFQVRNNIFNMNNWKESDWFKNWLQLARHTENSPTHPDDGADFCPNDRNANISTGSGEAPVARQEWQVTE